VDTSVGRFRRPAVLGAVVLALVFGVALASTYALHSQRHPSRMRWVSFPLNNTAQHVVVRSSWTRGHMTPQDDQVELTLDGQCFSLHLYAYLSRNWTSGPVDTAKMILGRQPSEPIAAGVQGRDSGFALAPLRRAAALVRRSGQRDYDALVAQWERRGSCRGAALRREIGDLTGTLASFKVL
jgi:hypothetical protein